MTFRITFLGTGGGRHTTMYQVRSTGGMLIEHDDGRIHMDPGPGAMTQMHRIHCDPGETDSVMISHCHPDHYSDAESVIEGMTRGGWVKRGHVYGSPTVIEGCDGLGPCISPYHLRIAAGKRVFRPGDVLDVDGLRVDIHRAVHSDPTNVGFTFHTEFGKVSYLSDTEYSDDIADQYEGTRVAILPVTTPSGNRIRYHMCTDDAILFAERIRPELILFTHLGVVILKRGADSEAAMVEGATGVRTVAARDRMTVDVGKDVILGEAPSYDDEWIPHWSP